MPDERLVFDVVQLHREGMTGRAIARALKISRNTVRQIIVEHTTARQRPHSALPTVRPRRRPSKLDPFRPRIAELFAQYPTITAQRVFEILRAEEFDGGYTVVKDGSSRFSVGPGLTG